MRPLKLPILTLLIVLLTATVTHAQCILHAGDIAFTGFNIYDDNTKGQTQDDQFSFNLIKPIPSGTVIYFTDLGWTSSAGFQTVATNASPLVGAATDGEISWTATSNMAAGTQVIIKCKYSLTANTGTVAGLQQTYNSTLSGHAAYLDLGIAGDQIFAFTGSLASPTFIAGIAINRSGWDAALSNQDFTSCQSQLPAGLNVAGVQNLNLPSAYNGYISNLTQTGTPSALISYVNTAANWTTNLSTAIPATQEIPTTIAFTVSGTAFSTFTTPVCQGATGVSYVLTASANYSSYAWSYTGTGLSGLTTTSNSQSVSFSNTATSGTLSVIPSGACGTYPGTSSSVVINPLPAQPASFTTSSAIVSAGASGVPYTVPNDPTLLDYQWSYSGLGATINGTTNSVTIDFSTAATSGTLSVAGQNSCGTGPAQTVAITVSPVSATPTTLPTGTAGVAYTSTQLMGSGGKAPYTFAISSGSLPPGLNITASGAGAGTISGTPTGVGTFNFTVLVTDANNLTGAIPYSIAVQAPIIALSPSTLPNGTYGAAYNQTLSATGGNGSYSYSITSGALPPGLTLSSSGSITGTATAAGNYSFVVSASDQTTGAGAPYAGEEPYTVLIIPAPLIVTADNQTMPYGGPVPTLTASYSGFVNGDNAASLTTPPTISTTATASSSVAGNPYAITASGAVDPTIPSLMYKAP